MPTTFATVVRSTEDLAAFLYTSGTTGRSKGAMLTQENLLSNGQVLTTEWAFTASDVLLHALPIFHTHGLFVATNIALLSGCKILFLPKFDLDAIIDLLPQATALMGVPTFYTRLWTTHASPKASPSICVCSCRAAHHCFRRPICALKREPAIRFWSATA